jgi:hypothetical protein
MSSKAWALRDRGVGPLSKDPEAPRAPGQRSAAGHKSRGRLERSPRVTLIKRVAGGPTRL